MWEGSNVENNYGEFQLHERAEGQITVTSGNQTAIEELFLGTQVGMTAQVYHSSWLISPENSPILFLPYFSFNFDTKRWTQLFSKLLNICLGKLTSWAIVSFSYQCFVNLKGVKSLIGRLFPRRWMRWVELLIPSTGCGFQQQVLNSFFIVS